MLSRLQFCVVADLDVGAFKIRSHRGLLPFDATRNAERKHGQYTFFEGFLTLLANDFSENGLNTVRACEAVARLSVQLASQWALIGETAADIEAGSNGREVLCGVATSTSTSQIPVSGTLTDIFEQLREHDPIVRVSPLINASRAAARLFARVEREGIRFDDDFWTPEPKFALLALPPSAVMPDPAEIYARRREQEVSQ